MQRSTSDLKRAPVYRLMTRLAAEKQAVCPGRPVRILNVMGLRAEESPGRAMLLPFRHDERASNNTVRHVDQWLPIHGLSVAQVWQVIGEAGTRPHWVYERLPRLSCRFCVLAGRDALVNAAILDPAGAERRAQMEARMGHRFRQDLSMAEIIAAAGSLTLRTAPAGRDWTA